MPAVSRRGRPRRTWPQRLVIATGLLLSTLLAAAAATIGYERWKLEQIGTYSNLSLVEPASGEAENYLIVGSDSRDGVDPDAPEAGAFLDGPTPGGQRSDTVLIARVDPGAEQVHLLSLPRDLWIPIAGTDGRERINTAYSHGRQQLVDTVEGHFGIPLHHYVEVDFVGFRSLVESIDGIPMWFDSAMRDLRSGLWISGEGCVRLDGDQALALARSRELQYLEDDAWVSDPTGDLGRITRQQVLILKALERSVELDLTDPAKFDRVIDVGVDSVTVDEGVTFDDMAGLVKRFQEVNDETLVTHSLPVVPYTTAGGADVLDVNEAAAGPVLDVFRGVEADGPIPSEVPVRVLNGTGVDGQAAAVGDALTYLGFPVAEVSGLGGLPVAVTQVRFHPDDRAEAELVARHLPIGATLLEDGKLTPGAVALVTGLDLEGIRAEPHPQDALSEPHRAGPADELPPSTTMATPGSREPVVASEGSAEGQPVGKTPGEEPEGVDCR